MSGVWRAGGRFPTLGQPMKPRARTPVRCATKLPRANRPQQKKQTAPSAARARPKRAGRAALRDSLLVSWRRGHRGQQSFRALEAARAAEAVAPEHSPPQDEGALHRVVEIGREKLLHAHVCLEMLEVRCRGWLAVGASRPEVDVADAGDAVLHDDAARLSERHLPPCSARGRR